MSDIFISYAKEDLHRVMPLVREIEAIGWSVFWDRTIPVGKTWQQIIGAEIESCRCMVVIWSAVSINKEWVYEEAAEGKRRGVLAPVLIDDILPPIGFRSIQAAKLVGWTGDKSSDEFHQLIRELKRILENKGETQGTENKDPGNQKALSTKPGFEQEAKTMKKEEREHIQREQTLQKGSNEAARLLSDAESAEDEESAEHKAAEKAELRRRTRRRVIYICLGAFVCVFLLYLLYAYVVALNSLRIVDFRAEPQNIQASQRVTLTWTVKNANAVELSEWETFKTEFSGPGPGRQRMPRKIVAQNVDAAGSMVVTRAGNRMYVLEATNSRGSLRQTQRVNVEP
jgi:hypothetical protein